MKTAHLGPLPSVSKSFSADLRFSSTDQLVRIPGVVSALCETDVPILVVRTVSVEAPIRSSVEESPVAPAVPIPSVISRLAVFLPHFRVEGKHYAQSDRQLPLIPTQNPHRKGAGSQPRPVGVAISKWDALWPLLQPPLNFAFPEALDLPSDLRPYQIDGIRFLADNNSALLGDEMGTGKTVQATVALRILFQKGRVRRALIVCPLAVLSSWERHVSDWGRVLNWTTVRGSKAERRLQWRTSAHVYIATYETVREDVDLLSDDSETPGFDLLVADEIQKIKNSTTAVAQAVRSLASRWRWGLSATPFENRPEELVAVFAFLKPGLLTRDREDAASIRRKIKPYFLRRTKEVLSGELPEKTHDVVWLELGRDQRNAYDLAEKQGVVELEKQGERVTVTHVLALLQKLKQLCNFEPKTGASIKLEALRERLDEVYAQGSKALVFSQFKDDRFGVQRILRGLRAGTEAALCYTGDLSYSERERALKRFAEDPGCRVMLCTQAAAGLGLNLTSANYVFHFDHWWNPARTAQAEDRVHRIGQTKNVFVYHLWVKDSVEERIYKILERKRAQFEEVIGPMSNAEGTGLSEDELFEVFGLKRGSRPTRRTEGRPAEPLLVRNDLSAAAGAPDVDVWPLIRQTELRLRRYVREVLVNQYGTQASEKVFAHLGGEEADRIRATISQYKKRYAAKLSDEFSPSEDPLDYTYLKQMMTIISREWRLFQPTFRDRGYIDAKLGEIAAVRNDEAHFRGIPPVEKMRAYVACADLLARLQPASVTKEVS